MGRPLKSLLAAYDLATHAPVVVQQSRDRATYRVGARVVKIYRAAKTAHHHALILERLQAHDVPAPRLIRTRAGDAVVSAEGWTAVAMTDVGERSDVIGESTLRVLGEITGRLHVVPMESIPDSPFTLANERARIVASVAMARRESLAHVELTDDLLAAFAELCDLDAFPRGILHTDIATVNSVIDSNGNLTLIDWDDAGVGACMLDIGYALVHGAVETSAQWNARYARSFLEGYASQRALTPQELAAIPDAMTFGSLIYVIADWVPEILPREWARASWVRANRDRILADLC